MGSHCDYGDYYFDVSMTFIYTMYYSSCDRRLKIKHVQKFLPKNYNVYTAQNRDK